jgi:hypothetical protein
MTSAGSGEPVVERSSTSHGVLMRKLGDTFFASLFSVLVLSGSAMEDNS